MRGTQRVEPATVLSYMSIRQGEAYDELAVDKSLKTLFATGLFADVKFNWNGSTLTVNVVENPIINQVDFEGNDKVSTKDLIKEVQLKPRTVFTRNKVQADVQRIIELYRRNGKFAATVDPEIIQRPQNRVDLIFSIHEGPTTGVARIAFIGNKVFDDSTLRDTIATQESAWWRILSSNDNYDPDRLTFDREQLRRFYLRRGYADFEVKSAVAELTPERKDFYLTFTIHEGKLYHFGKVEIKSSIKELTPKDLRPMVPIVDGSTYDAEEIDKSIDALTNAAGEKGYAFAQVHPRIRRNRKNHTIAVIFNVEQGPRVYVEKINITGNTRTLDKVIRRQFRLAEGDAFNRVLVDRSRNRIKALGFFKDVKIKTSPGSAPDRTVLDVQVQEQSTGQLQLGAGYSSTSSFVGQFSYQQSNLFGRGQFLRASVSMSSHQPRIPAELYRALLHGSAALRRLRPLQISDLLRSGRLSGRHHGGQHPLRLPDLGIRQRRPALHLPHRQDHRPMAARRWRFCRRPVPRRPRRSATPTATIRSTIPSGRTTAWPSPSRRISPASAGR